MEKLALVLFFLGCLNLFERSRSGVRLMALGYLVLAVSALLLNNPAFLEKNEYALILLVIITFFYLFVTARTYLTSSLSLKMDELNDFDD